MVFCHSVSIVLVVDTLICGGDTQTLTAIVKFKFLHLKGGRDAKTLKFSHSLLAFVGICLFIISE